MKSKQLKISRLYLIPALTLLSIASFAQRNELTTAKVTVMLKGYWVSEEDSTFSISVLGGDSIIESRSGQPKFYEYTLGRESCDPDADVKLAKKTTTGYYINESSAYDGVEYCNAIVAISDSSMVWFSTDGMMDLRKKK